MSDLRDYNSSQWWFKELEGIWNADLGSAITHDMKRAAKVAINMVKEVEALHLKNTEAWREEYRKKQAVGVRFEYCGWCKDTWLAGIYEFNGNKEDYREVQEAAPEGIFFAGGIKSIDKNIYVGFEAQEAFDINKIADSLSPSKPTIPHAAERALWKAQREAGTNEVWITAFAKNGAACEIPVHIEPGWHDGQVYYVKPMKLTAKIIRRGVYKTSYYWEFFGTREEYRAECEKYGYVVVSEIKEVKPNTVKYYFALYKTTDGRVGTEWHNDKQRLTDWVKTCGYTIIGDIEEREIEA